MESSEQTALPPMLVSQEIPASSTTMFDVPLVANTEPPIRRFKRQAIQKISLAGGWLAPMSDRDLGNQFLETSVGLGVPLGSFDNILGVSPSFRVDWMNSQSGLDVPSELYDTGVSFFYCRPLSDRISMMAIVRPSVRSDFTTGDNALRLFGLGLIHWERIPDRLVLSAGAVYLDRADIPVLPAVGLTWTPNQQTKLDLRFPETRFSRRWARDGNYSETWSYLSAGLGGNTWAITRQSGQSDELSIRDVRLMAGFERVIDGGSGWFCEAGFAVARRLEYERTAEEISLSDGVLFQAGLNY